MRRGAIWLTVTALAGCGGDKDPECPPDAVCVYEDTDVDTDTDTDVDTDSDVDTDTDVDADTDVDTDTDTDTGDTGTVPTGPGVVADLSDCTVQILSDLEGNGSIDATIDKTYDANGWEVRIEVDDTDPATSDVTTITYNASGLVTRRGFDDDGNGVDDNAQIYTWTATDKLSTYCSDTGDDGTCEFQERVTYDPVTDNRSLYEQDSDGDGTYETTCTYTFDAMDRRTSYACSGGITQSADYTYSGPNPLDYVIEIDAGDDGSVNNISEYVYDTDDRLVFLGQNINAVGPNEYETTWTYDGVGNLTQVIFIDDFNTPNSLSRSDYTYDIDGYLLNILSAVDITGDGIPDATLFEDDYAWNCPP